MVSIPRAILSRSALAVFLGAVRAVLQAEEEPLPPPPRVLRPQLQPLATQLRLANAPASRTDRLRCVTMVTSAPLVNITATEAVIIPRLAAAATMPSPLPLVRVRATGKVSLATAMCATMAICAQVVHTDVEALATTHPCMVAVAVV